MTALCLWGVLATTLLEANRFIPSTVVVRRRMLEEIDEDKTLGFQQMSSRSAPCFSQYSKLGDGPMSARPTWTEIQQ
jgi:hypothetical protein